MDKKVRSTSDKEMQLCCLSICRDMHLETQVGPLANQLNVCLLHWYASVLNKRFLTPFRDGIRNHR